MWKRPRVSNASKLGNTCVLSFFPVSASFLFVCVAFFSALSLSPSLLSVYLSVLLFLSISPLCLSVCLSTLLSLSLSPLLFFSFSSLSLPLLLSFHSPASPLVLQPKTKRHQGRDARSTQQGVSLSVTFPFSFPGSCLPLSPFSCHAFLFSAHSFHLSLKQPSSCLTQSFAWVWWAQIRFSVCVFYGSSLLFLSQSLPLFSAYSFHLSPKELRASFVWMWEAQKRFLLLFSLPFYISSPFSLCVSPLLLSPEEYCAVLRGYEKLRSAENACHWYLHVTVLSELRVMPHYVCSSVQMLHVISGVGENCHSLNSNVALDTGLAVSLSSLFCPKLIPAKGFTWKKFFLKVGEGQFLWVWVLVSEHSNLHNDPSHEGRSISFPPTKIQWVKFPVSMFIFPFFCLQWSAHELSNYQGSKIFFPIVHFPGFCSNLDAEHWSGWVRIMGKKTVYGEEWVINIWHILFPSQTLAHEHVCLSDNRWYIDWWLGTHGCTRIQRDIHSPECTHHQNKHQYSPNKQQ